MMSWRQVLGIVIAVVAVVTQQYWALKGAAAFWFAVGTGFVSGYVATGTLQGGLYGAFSAGVFFGIGQAFSSISGPAGTGAFGTGLNWGEYAAKVLAHGVAGGVMNTLMGGKFGDGFLSAGVAQAFGPAIDRIPGGPGARVAAAAILGGTVSKLSGGKFANGAITAAFSRAFNEEFHLREIQNANKVTAYIDDYIAKHPNQPIPLNAGQFGALAEKDYLQAQDFVNDNPDMSNREFVDNMQYGPGDGVMVAYQTQVFNISGLPGGYSGIHLGSDINYMLQGMAWTAKGIPMGYLNSAIEAHNFRQFMGDARSGNFSFRNIIQIQHAEQWADFGHSYYLQHSGAK
jgi:hypothetical protein